MTAETLTAGTGAAVWALPSCWVWALHGAIRLVGCRDLSGQRTGFIHRRYTFAKGHLSASHNLTKLFGKTCAIATNAVDNDSNIPTSFSQMVIGIVRVLTSWRAFKEFHA